MRYKVVLEKTSDDEVKATAYFTFADTYRWQADRGTFFAAFGIGDGNVHLCVSLVYNTNH